MKRMIAFIAVMILSFTGYNVYKAQEKIWFSDVAMANVEALAHFEGQPEGPWNCWWNTNYEYCFYYGVREGCPCGSENW